jgi:hypothetical protein
MGNNMKRSKTLSAVIAEMESREQAGVKKYGTNLDREDLSVKDLLQHQLEELLDAAMYTKSALLKIEEAEKRKVEEQKTIFKPATSPNFKIREKVVMLDRNRIYSSYKSAFEFFGITSNKKADPYTARDGMAVTVKNHCQHPETGVTIYHVETEGGQSFVIGEKGLSAL